ncbi:MAG: radical SAM protein [Oscillospiraceae bacterium]
MKHHFTTQRLEQNRSAADDFYKNCTLCPRACGVNRTTGETGLCGMTSEIKIARADLHQWEEPCISGTNGAGTVFFSGCGLGCVFCQNHAISQAHMGYAVTTDELAQIFLDLQEKGAHNINLVTPTHFAPSIAQALAAVKTRLTIPVVYNCGGYESPETLALIAPFVDIFLPDVKFYSPDIAKSYCGAADYFEKALASVAAMLAITGAPVFENGLLKKGVIVRHLVLPTHRRDSFEIIARLKENFGIKMLLISLMNQYFSIENSTKFPALSRKTATFEYNAVAGKVCEAGFNGWFQERTAADARYVPAFSSEKPTKIV